MVSDGERGLSVYLDEVAAGTPAPGGGSVAAVVGALAAALGEMVVNLTLGREKYAAAEASLRPARDRLTALRLSLLESAAADEAAYQSYRDAASLPRTSDGEKTARTNAMQRALIKTTDVPLAAARSVHDVRGNAPMLADRDLAATYLADADFLEKAGRETAERAYRDAMGAAEED